MLKRKITSLLEEWKRSHPTKALLVTGARQVDKSFAIAEFASRSYEHFVSFDLIKQPDVLAAMKASRNADELFMALSAFGGADFVPGDTCVFIDEVQECKEAVTYVKYLPQNEGFDFVLSGSLLGVELRDVRSQPVGYLSTLEMFPLDFEEFCWAMGVGEPAVSHARACFESAKPVMLPVHERLLSLFHEYLMVGGMPDVVSEFAKSKNLAVVKSIQSNIVSLYRADITKYAETRKLAIKDVYDQLPARLDSQSKSFRLS